MTVLIPRTRTVNVRLSEAEYVELERFCVSSSARSISELVRNTMLGFIHAANPEPALALSVSENAAHFKVLQQQIEILSEEIAALRASAQAGTRAGTDGPGETEEVWLSAEEQGTPRPEADERTRSETES